MGRKKITITRIQDERNRQITFSKRKAGLLKKAYELSILCDVEIAVIMITSNKKLYQYASSNMNSILIRYTEFKDPDESKTNADILDDITKKEKGGGAGHDESGDEDSAHTVQNFLVTPQTQERYRKIDEEFDHLLRQNQVPPQPQPMHGIQTPLGSAPASMNVPAVMPVTIPVSSTSSVHRQIHQHLKGQLQGQLQQLESQKSSGSSAGPLSSGPMSSASSAASLFSPQSDLSSGSPAIPGGKGGQKSPMPPPQNTPTRLQTIRNQTLKLHLPGSGRNYISLPGPGSAKSGSDEGGANQNDGMDEVGEEVEGQDEGAGGGADKGGRPGSKPQLRVYIPGQKEFVPRTQATSPLAPVGLNTPAAGGGGVSQAPAVVSQTTTSAESLTTPILSLATPNNVFSSLPPLFSSIMGDFPFGQLSGMSAGASAAVGGGGGGNPGGGGADGSSAALVAFPVSIQPSASGGGMGNLVLQAQNMGQPFLLTPTYDRSSNPLMNSQGGPPSSLATATGGGGGAGGGGAGNQSMRDLEQLKQQYERTTQLIQQQLLLSQMTSLMQQQQQSQQSQQASQHHHPPPGGQVGGAGTEDSQDGEVDVGGGTQMDTTTSLDGRRVGGADGGGGGQGAARGESSSGAAIMHESGLGTTRETDAEIQANQFINGSDVMIGSRSQSDSLLRRTREVRDEELASKRPRLDTSVSAL